MKRMHKGLYITLGALAIGFFSGQALTDSTLNDAEKHLQESIRLLKAAQSPRQNQELYEKHRRQAINLCLQAQQHIKVAKQSAFLPGQSTQGR